jgi:hypothetical protein
VDQETIRALVEWNASASETIPTTDDISQPEEIRTLKIEGIYSKVRSYACEALVRKPRTRPI